MRLQWQGMLYVCREAALLTLANNSGRTRLFRETAGQGPLEDGMDFHPVMQRFAFNDAFERDYYNVEQLCKVYSEIYLKKSVKIHRVYLAQM